MSLTAEYFNSRTGISVDGGTNLKQKQRLLVFYSIINLQIFF